MGGRRRGQILFPPCLSQRFAHTLALQCPQEEGEHPMHVPRAGCVLGQGLPHGVASPGPSALIAPCSPTPFLLLPTTGHSTKPPHVGPNPTGATLLPQAHADGRHPAGTTAWRATTPSSRPSSLRRHTWKKTDTQRTLTHSQNQPQIWISIREN